MNQDREHGILACLNAKTAFKRQKQCNAAMVFVIVIWNRYCFLTGKVDEDGDVRGMHYWRFYRVRVVLCSD